MQELLKIMRQLRAPGGCPWDQEQTHQSLRPYMLEEAAEAVDAISMGDLQGLQGELGDVLLQVAFHAVIAEEAGTFDYQDVERGICEKLVRRHPHVFGDVQVQDADEVTRNWQAIKVQEAGGKEKHPLERIPSSLGALERSRQVLKATTVPKKSLSEVQQVVSQVSNDAAGVLEVLEAVVGWARSLDLNPEVLLRESTERRIREGLEAAP